MHNVHVHVIQMGTYLKGKSTDIILYRILLDCTGKCLKQFGLS
jgi:hypothetical protein